MLPFITFYDPDTKNTYVSTEAKSSNDIAIPNKPSVLYPMEFNIETRTWERVYEKPEDNDIDLGEAERLWSLASQSDDLDKQLMAQILMKLCNL